MNTEIINKTLNFSPGNGYANYINSVNGGCYWDGQRSDLPLKFSHVFNGNILYGVNAELELFDLIIINNHWNGERGNRLIIGMHYDQKLEISYNTVLINDGIDSMVILCQMNENTEDPFKPYVEFKNFDSYLKSLA